jgi:hypothetical protein
LVHCCWFMCVFGVFGVNSCVRSVVYCYWCGLERIGMAVRLWLCGVGCCNVATKASLLAGVRASLGAAARGVRVWPCSITAAFVKVVCLKSCEKTEHCSGMMEYRYRLVNDIQYYSIYNSAASCFIRWSSLKVCDLRLSPMSNDHRQRPRYRSVVPK